MAKHICTDAEFTALWDRLGSPKLVADALGTNTKTVHDIRERVRRRTGAELPTWNDTSTRRITIRHDEGRIDYGMGTGVAIVFSDAHYWPGVRTTMHRALLTMLKQLKPQLVVCNGDAFDGATISRWPSINWMDKSKKPSVLEELTACKEMLGEVEAAAPYAKKVWPFGNHDSRFEGRLASSAPEFEGMPGFSLKEHFPEWLPCWTLWVNDDTCFCHDWHNGMHAVWNNLLKGQCNYVTGHRHSAEVRAYTNARGQTIWGIDSGTLADALAQHNVDYQRGRHGNHRSGFGVLTWRDGRLLQPELALKYDEDHFEFRGHVLHADTGDLA